MSRFSNGTARRWARWSARSEDSSAAAGRCTASRSRYSAAFMARRMMRYVEGAMHARTLGLLAISLFLIAAAPAPSADAQAAFERGEHALAEGRLDQAIAAYKEALSKSPAYAAALNGLGLALFKQDHRPEAIQQFRAATQANPSFALAWSNLAFASLKLGD